ncbi:MAG: hypothetical protein Q4B04_02490 [bacterium]|nr:hypothetical protein [bacterium]
MKSKTIFGIITALALVFSVITLTMQFRSEGKEIKQQIIKQTEIDTDTKFIIKEYNNKIAVFSAEKQEPLYVLESPYVYDLPIKDRKLLSEGITVYTESELTSLLEDYDN